MNKIENVEKTQKPESPIIRTEYNGVQVTITFDETAEGEGNNVKQIIMDSHGYHARNLRKHLWLSAEGEDSGGIQKRHVVESRCAEETRA